MERISNLIVTEKGFTSILTKGSTIWLENKFTGEQTQVIVEEADTNILVATTTGNAVLSISATSFLSTFDVLGFLGSNQYNTETSISKAAIELKDKVLDITSSENIQKAKVAGEKAIKNGRRTLRALLDVAADALQ